MARRIVTFRTIRRAVRAAVCFTLVGFSAVIASLFSAPAWAPEDPWRLVGEVPIVRGMDPSTADLVAQFLDRHDVQLPAKHVVAISESIQEAGLKYGLDPKLLLAVILSESTFRVDAVSPKGAIGLMQLLPTTAEELAGQLDLEWGGDARLLDPETNIVLGTYYLKQLLETFGDDLNLALTAYNKGPGYVQRMQASGIMEATATNFPSAYAERVVGRMRAASARNSNTL